MSCPHAHQQNGSAERKHRHIVEVGLALLAHVSMLLKFWYEAFVATAYLINRIQAKLSTILHHLNVCSISSQITLLLGPLDVHVGLTSSRTTPTNSNSTPNSVHSWDTTLCTKDSSV